MLNVFSGVQCVVAILFCLVLRHCNGTCAPKPCKSASYRTGTFVKKLEGQILKGHVISSLSVTSMFACSHACVNSTNCSSFNYQHDNLGPYHICQMNDCVLSTSPRSHIQIKPGFSYYEDSFVRNGCMSGSCENSNECCRLTAAERRHFTVHRRSCKDWFDHGYTKSGIFAIDPDGLKPFNAYCDHVTGVGGWTVFQRRQDGTENFNRSWTEYKAGFGNLSGEFWLGNEKLHRLTRFARQLRVDISDFNADTAYATYDRFSVANESDGYRLFVADYNGTAGDSFISSHKSEYVHNGMKFTTRDRDNDASKNVNCGSTWRGGWWFNACFSSCLNGEYKPQGKQFGVNWCSWKRICQTLKTSEMKLRPL